MQRRSPSTLVSALVMAGLALTAPLGACNNESEGQPCDQGSGDCQSPLVCNAANRCCPPTGQSPTTEICGATHPGVANSNPPPVEASVPTGPDGAGPDGSSGGSAASDGSDGAPSTTDGPSE